MLASLSSAVTGAAGAVKGVAGAAAGAVADAASSVFRRGGAGGPGPVTRSVAASATDYLLADMNDYVLIDSWVFECAKHFGVRVGPRETLILHSVLEPAFCALADKQIMEAGHTGGGGVNDCLIHSLLACLSDTFRKIDTNANRNIIANFFRRTLLVKWEKDKLIGLNKDGRIEPFLYDDKLDSKYFLSNDVGDAICRKLKINMMWCENSREELPAHADFIENAPGAPIIAIHGDQKHFQPIKLSESYMLKYNFNAAKWQDDCFKAEKPRCAFKLYQILKLQSDNNFYQIMERQFSRLKNAPPGTPPQCTAILLEGPLDPDTLELLDKKKKGIYKQVVLKKVEAKAARGAGRRRTFNKRRTVNNRRRSYKRSK